MAAWQLLEAALDGLVGAAFAESVRIAFLKNGRTDPERDAADIQAILHVGAGNASGPMAAGNEFKARIAAGDAELVIDRSRYTDPLPRPGDKVRANERAGQPWFEVASVTNRYNNLIVLALNHA